MSQTPSHDRPSDVTSAAPANFTSNLSDAVRDNPLSAALITMGAAWLFMGGSKVSLFGNRQKQHRPVRHARDDEHLDFGPAPGGVARDTGYSVEQSSGYGFGGAASSVSSAVSGMASGIKQAASSAGSTGSAAAETAAEGFGELAAGAGRAASSFGTSASELTWNASVAGRRQAEHLGHALSDFFEDQPLALGAVGLAIGAGIAAVLPATEAENRFLGEASQSIKEQATDLVKEGFETAKQFAGDAASRVAGEASSQGLTQNEAADAARTVGKKVSNVAAAAADALKRETGSL